MYVKIFPTLCNAWCVQVLALQLGITIEVDGYKDQ
jgi:hypothetical protein